MNPYSQPSRVHSDKSIFKVGILGVLAIALTVGIPFASSRVPSPVEGSTARVAAEALIAFLCLLVALLGLQRFLYQRPADSWFVALAALGLGFFSMLALSIDLDLWVTPWTWATLEDRTLSISTRLFLTTYLLFASTNSRLLVSDRRLRRWVGGGLFAALLFWLGTALFGVVLAPALRDPSILSVPVATLVEWGIVLLTCAAVVVSGREAVREQDGGSVLFALAAAALLGVSLSHALFLSDGWAWDLVAFLGVSVLLLIALMVDQMRFVRVETGLRRQVSQTNAELAKSERAYRTLVENLGEGIATVDRDGRITYCNPRLAQLLETRVDLLRGRSLSEWVSEDQLPILRSELRRLSANEPRQFELDLLTAKTKRIRVNVNAAPVFATAGRAFDRARSDDRYVGARLLLGDLSIRRRVERRLSELMDEKARSLRVYEQCLENVTEGVVVLDRERRVTYVNRTFEEMTGYLRSEVVDEGVEKWFKLPAASEDGNFWRRLDSGRVWRGEVRDCRKDRSEFVAEVSLVPLRGGEGSPDGYLAVLRDVTQQKRMERALRESAERLRRKSAEIEHARNYYEALIAGVPDILIVVDADGRCTFVNEYGRRRLGYDASEFTKTMLPPFFTDLERLEREYGDSIKVEVTEFEHSLKTRHGDVLHCSWYARPLFDHHGERIGAMAVGRDITELKHLQRRLREHARGFESKVQERTADLKRRVEQLAKVLEIDEEIRLDVDLEVVLSRICDAIGSLGWRRVLIALRDLDSGTSRIAAAAGLSPEERRRVETWGEIPFEFTSRYFQERFRISNSYFVDEKHGLVEKDDPYTVYADLGERTAEEWNSLDALIVPIRSRGAVLGIITVDDPEDRQKPTLQKVRDLEVFADKAALAIENDQILRQQRENESRARFLAETTRLFHTGAETSVLLRAVVEKSVQVLGDLCAVVLVDEKESELRPAAVAHRNPDLAATVEQVLSRHPEKVGEGLAGKVVAAVEPLFLQRVNRELLQSQMKSGYERLIEELDPRSLMVVPLQLGSVALGAIYYLSSMQNRSFTGRDLRFAQDLADRLALALENARLFEETKAKARELARASQLKSEFLANVSHELRTPLHTILTFADILLRDQSEPLAVDQRRQVEMIQRSGRHLLTMINDILDLSKIEVGETHLVLRSTNLQELIEQTVEPFRALCSEKGLGLKVTWGSNLPQSVITDADKLAQVLRNLLSNAVKFTPRGKISVDARRRNGEAVAIRVRDTGIGIPADRFDTIFEAFKQLDSSDARQFGGTGLGLAIARRLVKLLGGELEVESELGRGSCFTVVVPLFLVEEPMEEAVPAPESLGPTAVASPHTGKQRARLLVVDDDSDAQYAMQYLLEEEGFEVTYARSGAEALTLARRTRPDAILLDMMMPGMDGYKTAEALKRDPATREIPVIATTAKAMRGDREKVLSAGCDDYLAKPFEAAQLIDTVLKWTEKTMVT